MNTAEIIRGAREHARLAGRRGLKTVRLPVTSFEEWAQIYGRADDEAGREAYRRQQKRNFYFKHFLEGQGIEVTMVTCRAQEVAEWAAANGHPMTTDQERTHVLAHYAGRPELPPAMCVQKKPLTADLAGSGLELFATMTMYGESPEAPEILSTAIHTRDGWVVESLEVLGAENTPEEAFDLASRLMARHGVKSVFQDSRVRRPEFCPDCNELVVGTAGPHEYERLKERE